MFSPADDYLFISFRNVRDVWPSSESIVFDEAPATALISPLDTVASGVYGLFTLYPPPWLSFFMLPPSDDSLFILFSPADDSLFVSFAPADYSLFLFL